ncbi:MAG: GTP-binding protein [Flavobacteriales bacterium]|nr:GTP-binding protein [Flavobacteriales bacterium]
MAHKAGYVNIIGEPNTGKSTLLNALLGEDLVIVNPKAQTTRHRILGLLNGENYQVVLSDTPGIIDPQYPMQERMMDAVNESLSDADILIVMVELGQRPERSGELLKRARWYKGPMVLLLNKVDTGDDETVSSGT